MLRWLFHLKAAYHRVMKNGFIVVLLVAVGFLFYQNVKLKNEVGLTHQDLQNTQESIAQVQTKVFEQSAQIAAISAEAKTTSSSSANSATSSPVADRAPPVSNVANTEQVRLDSLIQERQQLQREIQELTPQSLNRLILQKNQDLYALRLQIKNYQTNQHSSEQDVATTLQFQNSLNRQTEALLEQRIRKQERVVRDTQRKMMLLKRIPNLNGDDEINSVKNQLAQEQGDLQTMQTQKETTLTESIAKTSALGNQVNNSKATLANTQAAIQRQIEMIQQDIASLQLQKNKYQNTTTVYKQQLHQLDQAIQAQKKVLKQAKGGAP
jgi:DNA repair exonuclease SbcCD ATPase subunit